MRTSNKRKPQQQTNELTFGKRQTDPISVPCPCLKWIISTLSSLINSLSWSDLHRLMTKNFLASTTNKRYSFKFMGSKQCYWCLINTTPEVKILAYQSLYLSRHKDTTLLGCSLYAPHNGTSQVFVSLLVTAKSIKCKNINKNNILFYSGHILVYLKPAKFLFLLVNVYHKRTILYKILQNIVNAAK